MKTKRMQVDDAINKQPAREKQEKQRSHDQLEYMENSEAPLKKKKCNKNRKRETWLM